MKKILFLLLTLGLAYSCNKDFGDLNVDIKNPAKVPPGALFSYSQKELVDIMTSSNVNDGIFRLISQYWTETTYVDESNYDLATRNIPQNFWNTLYVNVLKNLKEAEALIPDQDPTFVTAAVKTNQNACAEILSVYAYSVLVNTFGNVPYSQALDIANTSPVYDDAASIYTDLLLRLDRALTSIDETAGGFDSNDPMLGGDMARWKTFGTTLKLRLGMMLADKNPGAAQAAVEAAAAGPIISSNAENIIYHYLAAPPNTNPIWVDLVQSGRKDFVVTSTVVDTLLAMNDPRVPLYFTTDATGGYSGGYPGASNNYSTYSKPADAIQRPDFEAILMDYSEVEFLLAEARERQWSVPGGTAADHYKAAVEASITYWGGTSADATAYLAQPAVDYATAPGDWKAKIGFQKWIALYNRGFDGWTEIRRLDNPVLPSPDDPTSDFPVRFTYPVQEQNLNTREYNNASTAIGGDDVTTKLFWDVF